MLLRTTQNLWIQFGEGLVVLFKLDWVSYRRLGSRYVCNAPVVSIELIPDGYGMCLKVLEEPHG